MLIPKASLKNATTSKNTTYFMLISNNNLTATDARICELEQPSSGLYILYIQYVVSKYGNMKHIGLSSIITQLIFAVTMVTQILLDKWLIARLTRWDR